MTNLIQQPTVIMAAGNMSKEIAEYVGRLNSATETLSIAHMKSPAGWSEPGQTPEFNEYTVVLRGTLRAETRVGCVDVEAGQAILARRVNGCATARRNLMAPSMWWCVSQHFLRNWYSVTNEGSYVST